MALKQPIPWKDDPALALLFMLIAATWIGWPFMMLATTAGLKLLPADVYDASSIDGAGRWQQFRLITWPLLLPLLTPALILRAIASFNQFYLFYVMNPPFNTFATLSFAYFNTNNGFGGRFAVSAVLNVFTIVVLVGLLAWINRWSKAEEGVTYA